MALANNHDAARSLVADTEDQITAALVPNCHAILAQLAEVDLRLRLFELQIGRLAWRVTPLIDLLVRRHARMIRSAAL